MRTCQGRLWLRRCLGKRSKRDTVPRWSEGVRAAWTDGPSLQSHCAIEGNLNEVRRGALATSSLTIWKSKGLHAS